MKFTALDVETANPDMSSICQIGIAQFENGVVTDTWSSLVNPNDYFDDMNIYIHGITEKDVRKSPDFKQISSEINRRIEGQVVAIHTMFDRTAITRAALKHGTALSDCSWLNTACVARRTWPDVARKGYGLGSLAIKLGIEFNHHDALEDARAAGMILVLAMAETGLDLNAWLERVRQRIDLTKRHTTSYAHEGNPEGPLFGEVVAFTGALSIPRHEAAELAAKMGCKTGSGVTEHTTLLILGDQDIRKLGNYTKSSKHRKTEELIKAGKRIRIISEIDFLSMTATH